MTSVADFLYTLVIGPIEYIVETSFCLFKDFFSGPMEVPVAIASVSLLVNILALPIYNAADARQLEEREMQKKLSKWKTKINAAFKGDERFMMLAAYYKINEYSPVYALRGSLSVLVQIPFFIAAYHFLSKCPSLSGVRFGPIADLMKPDALLVIGSYSLNLMPVLMTSINLVSGMIYTRKASLREKIQVYGLAVLFLVLLYDSPSGLVFYWILNQLFSLTKNIIRQSRNPRRIVKVILYIALISFCLHSVFFRPNSRLYKKIALVAFTVLVCLLSQLRKIFPSFVEKMNGYAVFFFANRAETRRLLPLFIASCAGLVLLVGGVIPLSVFSSDPAAFSFLEGYSSPFLVFRYNLVKVAGLFLVWPVFIYGISADRWRRLVSVVSAILFFSALLNFYVFSPDYGILSDILVYEKEDVFYVQMWYAAVNAFVLIFTALLICILVHWKTVKFLFLLSLAVCISIAGHSFMESLSVKRGYERFCSAMRKNSVDASVVTPIIDISRNGKNVFCIMLDRATGAYLEECFTENARLYEQYDGFTFYPNAVSFSYGTLAGAPGLFGGYEYIPAIMNLKDDMSMAEKLEEATSVLPRIFVRNGYSSVMTDMPLQMFLENDFDFTKYPEKIKCCVTEGVYWQKWKEDHGFGDSIQLETDKKRFLSYAVLRAAPVCARSKLYDEGLYLITYYDLNDVDASVVSEDDGAFDRTIKCYSALDYLPAMTNLTDEGDTFTFMANNLTHSPHILQLPDYIPAPTFTRSSPSKLSSDSHYYVNMAALRLLGKWLDYLKENNVYDNTRIIIASDHGCGGGTKNVEAYSCLPLGELTCLLLVKDFGARGRLNVDDTFMTNADVPSIAVAGLIDNPINPATGNDITKVSLKNPVYGEYTDWRMAFKDKRSNTLAVDEGTWYSIRDDIFDAENWGRPSSAEVYEETMKSLHIQCVDIDGGAR